MGSITGNVDIVVMGDTEREWTKGTGKKKNKTTGMKEKNKANDDTWTGSKKQLEIEKQHNNPKRQKPLEEVDFLKFVTRFKLTAEVRAKTCIACFQDVGHKKHVPPGWQRSRGMMFGHTISNTNSAPGEKSKVIKGYHGPAPVASGKGSWRLNMFDSDDEFA